MNDDREKYDDDLPSIYWDEDESDDDEEDELPDIDW